MNAKQLFHAGRLNEAVQALGAELRSDPTDVQRRTFLFELLCFSGEYDRAEKQLNILADSSKEAGMGSLIYRSALHAEKTRKQMFEDRDFPSRAEDDITIPAGGTVNGKPFESIEDGDSRIGARLEVFAAGAYLWLPFQHILSIEAQPPKRLRDLIWIPAVLKTAPSCKGMELGEVLIPVLTPLSTKSADDEIRLGRRTDWVTEGDDAFPAGQKVLLVDGEEFPILELRTLEFPESAAVAT